MPGAGSRKPVTSAPAHAAMNAPTMPPWKRSGTSTAKCQNARPTIDHIKTAIATPAARGSKLWARAHGVRGARLTTMATSRAARDRVETPFSRGARGSGAATRAGTSRRTARATGPEHRSPRGADAPRALPADRAQRRAHLAGDLEVLARLDHQHPRPRSGRAHVRVAGRSG